MKMYINKELYDTAEAELCGTNAPYKSCLYRRTDDGTFFLVRSARESCRTQADFKGARLFETVETIFLTMTDAEAETWAEHNLDPDTVYKLFGD